MEEIQTMCREVGMNTIRIRDQGGVRWIAVTALTVATTMCVSACSFADASWLSPELASAQAGEINVEATHRDLVYRTDERLYEKQIDAQINAIERQEELADLEHSQHLDELEKERLHQEALRQQEIAERQLRSEHEAALIEALTIAVFIGLLMLCAGMAIAIVILATRRSVQPSRIVHGKAYWDARIKAKQKEDAARAPVAASPQKADNKQPQYQVKRQAHSNGNQAKDRSGEKETQV